MKGFSLLTLALFGLMSAPAFGCGGDKDDDKDNGLRPTQEVTTGIVYCGGDKDDDKDDS